ncbi:TPA: hypothetical protein HA265_02740 [Candidatus Woesearchaeota archaeon]|nr:hypothetical protein [Candidatus Woesearchaeota archaeon]
MAKKKKNEEEVMEDEDWFDDDDEEWEEEKPKKKAAGKKKERSTAWIWVVAFIVILAILLLVRYKYAAPSAEDVSGEDDKSTLEPEEETRYVPESERETASTTDEEEGYDSDYQYTEGPKDVGDAVVTDEEIQTGDYKQASILGEPTNEDEEHARDISEEPQLFSNLDCDYDYDAGVLFISLRIYNVLDEDILISPKGVAKGYNTYFMTRGIVDRDPGCGTEVLHPGQYTECTRIGDDTLRYGNIPGTNRISVEVPKKTEALIINCPEIPVDVEEE